MELFNNVLGMVSEPDLLLPGFTVSRQNDPIDGLFDDQRTENLVAKWHYIANQYQIPQMAQFHGFDTVSQKSIRVPVDEKNVEKGLIKVKRNTSELLYELMNKGINAEPELYRFVMDDVTALADQVVTRTKVAKNELLATGKVTIKENDLDLTVDFGVPEGQVGITFDVGAGASSTVIDQLQQIVDDAADVGVTIGGMVCSRKFLSKLRQNAALQKAINGTYMSGVLLTNDALRNYLSSEFGISQVVTNDLSYSTPYTEGTDGRPVVHSKRYFPKDKVTFFGTANGMRLGTGLWGTPPEEQIARFGGVTQSGESPYVYVHQWAEDDPAVVWTKASALFMPVLYNPNSLFIAEVVETPGA